MIRQQSFLSELFFPTHRKNKTIYPCILNGIQRRGATFPLDRRRINTVATVKNRIKSRVCVDRVCKLAPQHCLEAAIVASFRHFFCLLYGTGTEYTHARNFSPPDSSISTPRFLPPLFPPLFFARFRRPGSAPREQCREIRRRINRFLRDITFIPSALARLHPLSSSSSTAYIHTPPRTTPPRRRPPFGEPSSTSLEA